jgi:low affinity Fe/Cu permease
VDNPAAMEARTRKFQILDLIRNVLTRLGVLTANPIAFLVVALYAVAWLVFSLETFEWHGVVTLATLSMTLFIQRATHRDTQALHAKLDELLHAQQAASNALTRIDEKEPEDIEQSRTVARRHD